MNNNLTTSIFTNINNLTFPKLPNTPNLVQAKYQSHSGEFDRESRPGLQRVEFGTVAAQMIATQTIQWVTPQSGGNNIPRNNGQAIRTSPQEKTPHERIPDNEEMPKEPHSTYRENLDLLYEGVV